MRTSFRPLNQDEEQLDLQCQESWKKFLFKLQDSVQFVNTQSPQILEQLEALFQVNLSDTAKKRISTMWNPME